MDIERLLNPQNYGIFSNNMNIVTVDGIEYRTFIRETTEVLTGSCQCFKDCYCSEDKGRIIVTTKRWYRAKKYDNTGKCFYNQPMLNPVYNT